MQPTVISPTIQEFLGVRYYRHGRTGFFPRRKNCPVPREMISRAVWRDAYGNIPHGWVVHHKDRDRTNNQLENLIAMAPLDHADEHREEAREMMRRTNPVVHRWRKAKG
jgi:hypothetical protein